MKIYNSLSKTTEEFVALKKNKVGMYTCGPTVYSYATIGNFRTYTMADLLRRVLAYQGFDVTYVMNLTDVGHLTGDNLGDADTGEDRMEVAARKAKISAWDVAKYYTEQFLADYDKLNLQRPMTFCRATEHIPEQIELVKKLEEKGFTYRTSDGVYFDTEKFPKYGELSTLKEIKEGARVEINPEKHNPADFALWKFSPPLEQRQMEWESPWGKGFPGWHIECSAMAMKYLGESFDIHTGGEDLRSTHHPNEIAQSEAATGKPFVKYWLHGAFLLIDGQRMSKSLGNNFTVSNIIEKGFSPLALRYLYLTAHYRSQLNFTWSAIAGSQTALDKLKQFVQKTRAVTSETRSTLSKDKLKKLEGFKMQFLDAINDDLALPKAIAVVWEMLKSNIPDYDKADQLLEWDQVLGLGLAQVSTAEAVPEEVKKLGAQREQLRQAGKYVEADTVRMEIEKLGWVLNDTKTGAVFKKK